MSQLRFAVGDRVRLASAGPDSAVMTVTGGFVDEYQFGCYFYWYFCEIRRPPSVGNAMVRFLEDELVRVDGHA